MTGPEGFRCAVSAVDRAEPMVGTASTVRAFVLVEAPGAWGEDAVAQARLPGHVRRYLSDLARLHGIRVLLIRDHVRRAAGKVRVFAAYVASEQPWVETALLDDVREVPALALTGLAGGAHRA